MKKILRTIITCGILGTTAFTSTSCLTALVLKEISENERAEAEKQENERSLKEQKKLEQEREKFEKLKEQENKKIELEKLYHENKDVGINNMPWGTSTDDFLIAYPEAKDITEKEYKDSNYKVYETRPDYNNQIMTYYFFDDKLYQGINLYRNVEDDKAQAINLRLKELYGKHDKYEDFSNEYSFKIPGDDFGRIANYKEEGGIVNWYKSSNFYIQLDITGRYGLDSYFLSAIQNTQYMQLWRNSSLLDMKITYYDPEIKQKVKKYLVEYEKIKNQEKINQSMKNLNF